MCMDTVEQVRSRRSSEDASVGEQDTGHRAQIVLYGMAAYSLSDSVERRVSKLSSVRRSPG